MRCFLAVLHLVCILNSLKKVWSAWRFCDQRRDIVTSDVGYKQGIDICFQLHKLFTLVKCYALREELEGGRKTTPVTGIGKL